MWPGISFFFNFEWWLSFNWWVRVWKAMTSHFTSTIDRITRYGWRKSSFSPGNTAQEIEWHGSFQPRGIVKLASGGNRVMKQEDPECGSCVFGFRVEREWYQSSL